MCGIMTMKNLKDGTPINERVERLFNKQRDRGTDGFGFVGMSSKKIETFRHTREKGFKRQLRKNKFTEILLHHRFPTSTDNDLISTHPFEIHYGGKVYFFIHNGVLYNEDDLQEKHYKQGIKYTSMHKDGSFNDSEALAWDFVLYHSGEQTTMESIGGVAFICTVLDKISLKAEKMYFYRNYTQPLKIVRNKDILVISSECDKDCAKDVKFNKLYYYDYKSKNIIKDCNLFIDSFSSCYSSGASKYGGNYSGYNSRSRAHEVEQEESKEKKLEIFERQVRELEGEMYLLDDEITTLMVAQRYTKAEDKIEEYEEVKGELRVIKSKMLLLDYYGTNSLQLN